MSDIKFSDVTDGTINGNGYFDKTMKAYDVWIKREFEAERITGGDYATVFLTAMTHAMDKAMEFALNEERAGYEADLVGEQVITEGKAQDKLDAEIAVLQRQDDKVYAEQLLLTQKRTTERYQTENTSTGIVGKQQDLLYAQRQGYKRDAEQKVAKLYTDIFAIMYREGAITDTQAFGFESTKFKNMMDQVTQGSDNYDSGL